MSVYHIADLHLGHEKMAIKRGFNDSYSHDNFLIDQWNKTCHKNDKIFIHGDLSMEKHTSYKLLEKLKGLKVAIQGNHDMPQHTRELLKYVHSVAAVIKYHGYWLTHIPVHESEFDGRVIGNIHGHLHEENIKRLCFDVEIEGLIYQKSSKDKRYINVSCEQNNFTPQLFTELIKQNG